MINTQTTWIRPSQTLLDAVPSLRALVRSFEYKLPPPPPPSLVAPDIKVSRYIERRQEELMVIA
jgi:hypothetical protein